MKRAALIVLGVALIGAAFLAFIQSSKEPQRVVLQPDDPEIVALGRKVYVANCAACHGAGLEGQPDWRSPGPDGLLPAPPHDETGHTWHHDGDTLFRLTKYGLAELIGDPAQPSNMPAYEGTLTDAEIVAALSYIKSTWPKNIRARHSKLEIPQ